MDRKNSVSSILHRVIVLTLLVVLGLFPNSSRAAKYNYAYPTAPNKKGVALGADMDEDALELNIHHTTLNFPITEYIASSYERNSSRGISYRYKGKTYWFSKSRVQSSDRTLKKMKQNDVIVTGILLMQKRDDLLNLIYPAARSKKAAFYAWNMDGGKNQQTIEAAISFLANRYASGKYGRVVGWIVGNEIDTASNWNCAGNISFNTYMDLYARMFEASSRIVRNVYSNARVYVPLDHFWNMIYDNDYTAKACLDAFAKRMTKDGYPWNVAFHAYNGDLMQPSITAKQYFDTTNQLDTPIITMKNLGVLTNYIRTNFGEDKRVILSEHGYSSTWKGKKVQNDQSLAIALSYYLAESDPMVDSFIYYSQVDQNELTKVGASFGLWKVSKKETATSKKSSWKIFKYMDTDLNNDILNEARSVNAGMTGQYGKVTRSVMLIDQGKTGKYKPRLKLYNGWKGCGAVSSASKVKHGMRLVHDRGRNVNVYWGIQKKFDSLNASAYPHLALTIKGSKLTGVDGEVLVRVFSGNGALFESSGQLTDNKRRILIDLSGWQYKNAITRIQVLIKRNSGSWKQGASVKITDMGLI